MKISKPSIHLILLITTLFTTTAAGALQEGVDLLQHPFAITKGLPFSIALMAILMAHEAGHYVFARCGGIVVTYPYFIPAPTFIGTFGAFIKIKSPIPDRNILVRFSAAGPIAGFLVALIATGIGLFLSEVRPIPSGEHLSIGSSIIFDFLTKIIVGEIPPTYDIYLHPIAFAGWLGFFVTALNLLPVGQLDGGHILYAISKKWHNSIARLIVLSLIPLGFYWEGWFVWVVLLGIIGIKHPPVVNESVLLSKPDRYVAWISIIIFILTFLPAPFHI